MNSTSAVDATLIGAWWQVLAVVATAIVAGVIAVWGIQSQRAISRRTATLNYFITVDSDQDMIQSRKIFIQEASKQHGLAQWADPGQEHSPECEAIRQVLNDFELASVSIQLGTIDYEMYKRCNRGTVIRYWYAAAPFVYSLRKQTGSKSVYHEFEELARGFESGRLPPRSFWGLKFR